MKKFFLLILPIFLFANNIIANNVIIGTPTLTSPSPIDQSVYIEFDLSWENSWRNNTNRDAVWLFVKFKDSTEVWQHAYLDINSANHTVQNNNGVLPAFDIGLNDISGIDRGLGVFVHRNNNGTGNIDWQNVRLKWNYGENGVDNHASVTVSVFAIEMVYVPQGSFSIGDGSSFSRFHEGGNANSSYTITDAAISFSNTAGGLWALATWDNPTGNLSSSYPTGYNAFYSMKYSISQHQYTAFLNTLSREQQNQRTATNVASGITSITDVFVMSASATPQHRNGIRCNTTISANDPVLFYADLNNNGIINESDDGQHIACNYLSWADGAAYASWAGLRPMTETEYEKACRGHLTPVSGEYAWGSSTINGATSLINDGAPNETVNSGANCAYNNATGVQGPVRVGAFATALSDREAAGATFYGIMEMSGNLWERTISLASTVGRSFTGNHGNGSLTSQGDANVTGWPGVNAVGSGFRGGHWKGTIHNAKISARDNANFESTLRNEMFGFRLVRTE